MPKFISLLIIFCFLNNCSLDTKTGLWTKPEIINKTDKKEDKLEEIFGSKEILKKELNPNLKIKINSSYAKNSFVNNLTNNSGYINFDSDFNEISKFKSPSKLSIFKKELIDYYGIDLCKLKSIIIIITAFLQHKLTSDLQNVD